MPRNDHDKSRTTRPPRQYLLPLQALRESNANSDQRHTDHATPQRRTCPSDTKRGPHSCTSVRRAQASGPRYYPTRRTRGQVIRLAVVLLCFALMGCGADLNASFLNTVDGLNQRKVRSCLDTDLTVAGGGGLGAGVNGSIHARGVVITGGMTLQKCADYKKALQATGGQL